jgi:membrane protein implicated in regulation of membrane protease activity
MELWALWVILGVVFFIVEIFTPGFIVATFGIGCLLGAIPAYFHAHILWQLATFSAGTLVAFFAVRPLYLKFIFPPQKQVPTNVQALIGQQALVIEPIEPVKNKGRVKIGGEDWKAKTKNNQSIPKGTIVKIVDLEGVTLFVEPFSKE